ncbi:mechanosensitive ion channel family protein [Methyloceanibacter sp. wino2]|uniref:mechanosensitive ion channel family protein n=1 Tax=Methyloceanibacter sp. wino2 TaxID=2170729 RepID=UPI000D3E5DF6|nr:mechanosensitive ion channel domain-containing protein [Methyloceanibacter sp. wino2]
MNDDLAIDTYARLRSITGNGELSILLLLAGAVAIAVALHAVAMFVLRRLIKRDSIASSILKRISGPTRLAMVLLALVLALPAAEFNAEFAEATRQVLKVGVVVLLGWSAAIAINATARRVARRHDIGVEDNLTARRIHTQINILRRTSLVGVFLLTLGTSLMIFPAVRSFGVSLFASAGVAGLVLGFAARPILTNLIAGMQIALTQPIRIDDVLIVEGEWGWVEEITTTYVVIRIWDQRRLIVPLSRFIEQPFENWTRESAAILGVVLWHLDYRAPIAEMRTKLEELLYANKLWDGKVSNLQVVESGVSTITVRALMSARNSPTAWDLRCEIREQMLEWLRAEHPEALPRIRALMDEPRPGAGRGAALEDVLSS